MKVAVTAQGKNGGSRIAPHFARARFLLVVDTSSDMLTIEDNVELQQTEHLAGTQAAGTLISLGVQAVITEHIGPKAFATLRSAGVGVFQACSGTVAEALDAFKAGRLLEIPDANVGKHWPSHTET